jgi:hypothetical protein
MKLGKKTKLTKSEIKKGLYVSRAQHFEEVAYRKMKLDVYKKVDLTRKPVIVTQYGKQLAIVLPLHPAR